MKALEIIRQRENLARPQRGKAKPILKALAKIIEIIIKPSLMKRIKAAGKISPTNVEGKPEAHPHLQKQQRESLSPSSNTGATKICRISKTH